MVYRCLTIIILLPEKVQWYKRLLFKVYKSFDTVHIFVRSYVPAYLFWILFCLFRKYSYYIDSSLLTFCLDWHMDVT